MPSKILIVEDEHEIAEMLSLRLEDTGYQTSVVYDGKEALERIRSERPDLILLDYTLPHKKGDEICRELKSKEAYRKIPVILLSAYREDQIWEERLADAYLAKPYDPEELICKIKELIPS